MAARCLLIVSSLFFNQLVLLGRQSVFVLIFLAIEMAGRNMPLWFSKLANLCLFLVFILLAVRALMLKSCVCLFLGQFDFPRLLSLFVLIVFDNSIDCAELAVVIYRTSNSLCVLVVVVFVSYGGPVLVNCE